MNSIRFNPFLKATLLLLPMISCGLKKSPTSDSSNLHLVNATTINSNEYPAVVSITTAIGSCTATFISQDRLLTAAHCIEGGFPYVEVELANRTQRVPASATIHPEWDLRATNTVNRPKRNLYADLAILNLNAKVKVKPIPICSPQLGRTATAIGFGPDHTGRFAKRKGMTQAISYASGVNLIEAKTEGRQGTGGMNGDSGGPWLQNGCIVGVMSHVTQETDRIGKNTTYLTRAVNLKSNSSRTFLGPFTLGLPTLSNNTGLPIHIKIVNPQGLGQTYQNWLSAGGYQINSQYIDYKKHMVPFQKNKTYQVTYGRTCYNWTPTENRNYQVVLRPIWGEGCPFNWVAGCLEITGDKAEPVPHYHSCG